MKDIDIYRLMLKNAEQYLEEVKNTNHWELVPEITKQIKRYTNIIKELSDYE